MRAVGRAFLAALLTLSVVACDGEAPSADTVRLQLERQAPGASFRRDSRIHLGRFTLALARGVLRLVEPDDDARAVLSEVRRIEIVTYEVEALPPLAELDLPPRFERRLAEVGWTPMVRTRDDDERSWIYYREDDRGTVSDLYIVELDASELTIIDLAGNLSRALAELVADDPDGFLAEVSG